MDKQEQTLKHSSKQTLIHHELTAAASQLLAAQKAAKDSSKARGRICPRCKGTGICAECKGTGSTPCLSCSGKGYSGVNSRGEPAVCKTCGGEKTVKCSTECSSCLGTGVLTSEMQKEVLDKYAAPASAAYFTPWMFRVISVICVLVFLMEIMQPFRFNLFIKPLMMPYNPNQAPWELWRLITAAFLHGGFIHLMCNVYCLFLLGRELEEYIGACRFAAIFLIGAAAGSLLSSLCGEPSIGASGGIFALGAAYCAYYKKWALGNASMAKSLFVSGMLIIGLGVLLSFSGIGMLSNWGHAGGLAAGWLYAAVSKRPV